MNLCTCAANFMEQTIQKEVKGDKFMFKNRKTIMNISLDGGGGDGGGGQHSGKLNVAMLRCNK